MDHKLSKAQLEAKAYVETHNLEKILGDMLNTMVLSKDPNPSVFMIKYIANLANPEDLANNGISIGSIVTQKSIETKQSEEIVKIPTEIREDEKEDSIPEIKIPEYIPKPFPKFSEESKSLVKRILNEELWDKYKGIKTSLEHDLYDCVSIGINNPKNPIGIFAADFESYTVYKDVFMPIIQEYQNWRISDGNRSVIDPSSFTCNNLDENGDIIKGIVVSFERNLLGYSFPIVLTSDERINVQRKIQEILDPYIESSFTNIDDSRVQDADDSLVEMFHKKYENTEMLRD